MDGIETVTCAHCGEPVHFSDFWQPVTHLERAATDSEPRSYLIIGADRLLHRCEPDEG